MIQILINYQYNWHFIFQNHVWIGNEPNLFKREESKAYPKLDSSAPKNKSLITIMMSMISSQLPRSNFTEMKRSTSNSSTWNDGRKCESNRIKNPTTIILGDRRRKAGSESAKISFNVVVWGREREWMRRAIWAERDPSEEEEDGEDERERVRSLKEWSDEGGADPLEHGGSGGGGGGGGWWYADLDWSSRCCAGCWWHCVATTGGGSLSLVALSSLISDTVFFTLHYLFFCFFLFMIILFNHMCIFLRDFKKKGYVNWTDHLHVWMVKFVCVKFL